MAKLRIVFYTHAVLPQFGHKERRIVWTESRRIEGDEFAHYLDVDSIPYVLIWEGCEGLGRNQEFLENHVTKGAAFELVEPVSQTPVAPSYDGFRLPAPS